MEHPSFWKLFLFSAINFAIYLFVLLRFVFPKLSRSLEEARRKWNEARARLESAKNEASKIKEEIVQSAQSYSRKIIDDAKKEAEKKIEEAKKLVEMRVEEAKRELSQVVLELTIKMALEKIRERKTDELEKRFLDGALDKISKSLS